MTIPRHRLLTDEDYLPEFKGPLLGYLYNHVRRNAWKLADTMEEADLMQEGWLVFDKVRKTYVVNTPQHFNALFRSAWNAHFVDLCRKANYRRTNADDDTDTAAEALVGSTKNEGELVLLIKQAPAEIRMVLSLFINAPLELYELGAKAWQSKKRGVNRSQNINKLLGIDEGHDTIAAIKDYFG